MSIKIYIGSEIRRLNLSDIKDYSDLNKRLVSFAKNETSLYKYLDVDSDWVTFNSQEEWAEAVKNHHKDGFKIKIVSENEKSCPRFQHCKKEESKCPRFQQGCGQQRPKHCGMPQFFQGQDVNQFINQLGSIGKDLFGQGKDFFNGQAKDFNLAELFKSPHGEKNGEVLHRQVVCDGCNVTPIKGNRYRCNELQDFDLCQTCYDKKAFPKEHTFTVIAKPIGTAGFWEDFVKDIYKEAEKVNEKKEEIIVLEEEKNEFVEDQHIYEDLKPVEEKPVEPVVTPYADQLELLKSMGFFNTDANIVFLKKHGGNIQRVVAELLNQ